MQKIDLFVQMRNAKQNNAEIVKFHLIINFLPVMNGLKIKMLSNIVL